MRGWSTAVLTTMVLLAGCLGGSDAGEDATVDAASVGASEDGASSDAGAPSSSSPSAASPTGAPTSGGDESATGGAPVVVPIDFAGSLPAFVEPCVFVVILGTCADIPPAEFHNRLLLDPTGNATSLRVTLEWTAASPATEQMGVQLYSATEEDFERVGLVFGPSPLVFEITDPFVLREGRDNVLHVFIGNTGAGVGPAGAFVAASPAEQPFTLTGELVLAGPANP